MLSPGDPAPWFTARSTVNPKFHFDTAAGRYLVLCFFGSAGTPAGRRILNDFEQVESHFDVDNAAFFGISTDPEDERMGRLNQKSPGMMYFLDFDGGISRLYGMPTATGSTYRPISLVLDPALRVNAMVAHATVETHVAQVVRIVESLPRIRNIEGFAPVLTVPRVFDRDFCRMLIGLYEQDGGTESGFMRDVDGKTVSVTDYEHKRRSDYTIADQQVIRAAQDCFIKRLVPEIKKAFQFNVTRIERHVVACYDSKTSGHFRPHRDNTTKGTAHRRFAVTLNLNSDEYVGGDLRFPEFGPRTYRVSTGGAIVFSCSLLHEATPVTDGKRYAFLPFLYDEEAARIRHANLQFIADPT